MFNPHHIDLEITSRNDLKEVDLMNDLKKASGVYNHIKHASAIVDVLASYFNLLNRQIERMRIGKALLLKR